MVEMSNGGNCCPASIAANSERVRKVSKRAVLKPVAMLMGWRFTQPHVERRFVAHLDATLQGILRPCLEIATSAACCYKYGPVMANLLKVAALVMVLFSAISVCEIPKPRAMQLHLVRNLAVWFMWGSSCLIPGPYLMHVWSTWNILKAGMATSQGIMDSWGQAVTILMGATAGNLHAWMLQEYSWHQFALTVLVVPIACAVGSYAEYNKRMTFWMHMEAYEKPMDESGQISAKGEASTNESDEQQVGESGQISAKGEASTNESDEQQVGESGQISAKGEASTNESDEQQVGESGQISAKGEALEPLDRPGASGSAEAMKPMHAVSSCDPATHGTDIMAPWATDWHASAVHALTDANVPPQNKKQLREMSDTDLWELKKRIERYAMGELYEPEDMFSVEVTIPHADPCMLPEDAVDRLRWGLKSQCPDLHVMRVSIHKASLLVSMTVVQDRGTAAADPRNVILRLPPGRWLEWLHLPASLSSGMHVRVDSDKVRDALTSCLPHVVSTAQLHPGAGSSCNLVLPIHGDFTPESALVRAALGTTSLLVSIKSAQVASQESVSRSPYCLHVEGIQRPEDTCQVMVISTYCPSTRASSASHGLILMPQAWGEEQQEVQQLCDTINDPDTPSRLRNVEELELALSWAWWMDRSHALQLPAECEGGVAADGTGTAVAPEALGAFIKKASGKLKELVTACRPAMAERMLQVLLRLQGSSAMSNKCDGDEGCSLLHHAVLSGSPVMLDRVLQWIRQHHLDCAWNHPDAKGMTAVHLATMLDPENRSMLQHLLSKQDPSIQTVWLQGGGRSFAEIMRVNRNMQLPRSGASSGTASFSTTLTSRTASSASTTLTITTISPGSASLSTTLTALSDAGLNTSLVPVYFYMEWRFACPDLEARYNSTRAKVGQMGKWKFVILAVLFSVLAKFWADIEVIDRCFALFHLSAGIWYEAFPSFKYRPYLICIRVVIPSLLWAALPVHTPLLAAWALFAGVYKQMAEQMADEIMSASMRAMCRFGGSLIGSVILAYRHDQLPATELVFVWTVVGSLVVITSACEFYNRWTFLKSSRGEVLHRPGDQSHGKHTSISDASPGESTLASMRG